MQVLFDGDVVVYRAGFAAEKTHYYVGSQGEDRHEFTSKSEAVGFCERNPGYSLEGQERIVEPVENALYSAKNIILSSLKALDATEKELVVVLSGPTNFRNGVASVRPYKGNRDPDHRPVHGPDILEYLHKRFTVTVSEDEEADDVLGCLQTLGNRGYEDNEMKLGSVICTIDKDLDMIPGLHYNFKDEKSYFISDDTADRYFWRQMLTGDSTDNIQGVPGVGPKGADAIMKGVATADLYPVVRTQYALSYGDRADAMILEMGRLLWIRRNPGEWWNPPNETKA